MFYIYIYIYTHTIDAIIEYHVFPILIVFLICPSGTSSDIALKKDHGMVQAWGTNGRWPFYVPIHLVSGLLAIILRQDLVAGYCRMSKLYIYQNIRPKTTCFC